MKKLKFIQYTIYYLLLSFLSVYFIAILNSLLSIFFSYFILKTKFSKSIDFNCKFNLFNIDIEFPMYKKNFILILFISCLTTCIVKLSRDIFNNFRKQYKDKLSELGYIKNKKNKLSADKKNILYLMLITALFNIFRNFLRELTGISQFIFNTSNLSNVILINFIFIVILTLIEKYSVKAELEITNKFFNKKQQIEGYEIKLISNLKRNLSLFFYKLGFSKNKKSFFSSKEINLFFNRILIVSFGTLFSLFFSKLFVYFEIMKDLKFKISVFNLDLYIINNSRFLFTNIVFGFFFGSLFSALFIEDHINKEGEYYDSFMIVKENKLKIFFKSFINSILFSIGVSIIINIEDFFRINDNIIFNYNDGLKFLFVNAFGFFLLAICYELFDCIFEIKELIIENKNIDNTFELNELTGGKTNTLFSN